MFFPVGKAQIEDTKNLLKDMCHACPIYNDCLDYSLYVKVEGIWAATSENDRRHLRKERGIVGITVNEEYERQWFLSQSPDAIASRKHRASKAAETQRNKREEQTA
jgi:hypothetical protein